MTDRFSLYKDLLATSNYFKLVCGAGNEDASEVEYLTFIYTLSGCAGFDVSASPLIVEAANKGINYAFESSSRFNIDIPFRPFVTVSVGMPGDHHVRKALIDPLKCVECNLCIPVCPTDAIPSTLVIEEPLCIGCGNCEAVCPPAANAIRYKHNAKALSVVLPECVEAGAESIELHSGVPDDATTIEEWKVVSQSVPNGMISMCLDRFHLSNMHLIERIRMARDIADDRLIIQADGIPMSGGSDDFNTTLQAISIADIINKELKSKDKRFKKLPILISGGTNSFTGDLARQCSVPFNGITIGTHARKVISQHRSLPSEMTDEAIVSAVSSARSLIHQNIHG
jgi:ferredoxin